MATTSSKTNTAKQADLSVLRNPRITEKAADASVYNVYLFDVTPGATKNEIAKAFELTYKVRPIKVNTVNVIAPALFRRGRLGFGNKTKKAYVFLPKGTTIQIM
jgi:large subunit ribosomal protein L23